MALNLDGFVTPEQKMEGLYRATDTLERRRYREDQLAQQKEGKRASSLNFLNSYLDKKDYFTATPHDPELVNRLDKLLTEGATLANQGADGNTIKMALSPGVSKLNEYYTKAKLISEQKKQTINHLKLIPGIDVDKFSNEFDNAAFYDTDPKTGERKVKDISTVDPTLMYGDQVLKQADVFNNKGIDDFVAKSGKEKRVEDIYRYNKTGGLRRTKAEMVAPSYMTSDKDKQGVHTGFVPDYEIATDENQPILHKFKGESGEVEAPVRMVTKEFFSSLPDNAKGYILQETRKHAKENRIEVSSQQSEMFARALAYDELKQSAKNYSTVNELSVIDKPSPQEIRINLGYAPYGKTGGSETPTIDLTEYQDTSYGKNITSLMQGVKVTGLPDGKTLLAENVEYNPETKRVKYKEYVSQDEQGKYGKGQEREVSITKFKQDIKTNNPGIDMKFLDGLDNAITGKKEEPKATTTDDGYTRNELKKAGWTDDQINKAVKAGKIKVK